MTRLHLLTAGAGGCGHARPAHLLPAHRAMRMLPQHDFRADDIAKAIEGCSASNRLQITHGTTLQQALTADYIPHFTAVLLKLELISKLEGMGMHEKADANRNRLVEMLRQFKGYRELLVERFDEYAAMRKPCDPELDCQEVLRYLFDDNPNARALEGIANQIRLTVSPYGEIDYGMLRELINAQIAIFESVRGPFVEPGMVNRILAPYLH